MSKVNNIIVGVSCFFFAVLSSCTKEVEVLKEVPVHDVYAVQKAGFYNIISPTNPSITDSLFFRFALKISTLTPVDSVDFIYKCVSVNRSFTDIVIPRSEFTLLNSLSYISDSTRVLIYTSKKKIGRYIASLLGPGVITSSVTNALWVKVSSSYTVGGKTYARNPEDFNPYTFTTSPMLW